jgi:hypothetical protein
MSRLFPHPPYAEDQPLARTILTTHVLTRGIQTGSLLGLVTGTSLHTLRRFNILTPSTHTLITTLLRSTGVGAAVGFGLMAVATPMRIWGREEIEWQDRSWRLLENKGQVECDDYTYPGMAVGLALAAASQRGRALGWRGAAAGAGLGSVVGMMGYMGWRYGIKGGRFEEL